MKQPKVDISQDELFVVCVEGIGYMTRNFFNSRLRFLNLYG